MADLFGSEQSIGQWASSPRLEKAHSTRLHLLRESARPGNEMRRGGASDGAAQLATLFGTMIHDRVQGVQLHAFIVQHDWAAAFEKAEDFSSDASVKLPYPICAFEFRISGRHLVLLANEIRDDEFRLMASLETDVGWAFLDLRVPFLSKTIAPMMTAQVRAICVALEAQVAATELVRAPFKLNAAREKRGKQAIPDYHVVQLARRSRIVPLPDREDTEILRRVRLHFRRGHWRHFERHKTWIKWTLVGDPDLGFIEKHYRL